MAAADYVEHADIDNGNLSARSFQPGTRCSSFLTLSAGHSGVPADWMLLEAKQTPAGDNLTSLEQTTRSVIDAHVNTNNYSTEVLRRGFRLYDAIHHSTGERDFSKMLKSMGPPDPEKMLSFFLDNMAPTIKRVVAFANLLPGFVDLDSSDRMTLFKLGSFEVIVTCYTRLFTADGMLTPDMTVKIPRHLVHRMPLGELFTEQYEFADVFNLLDLTDSETGLVCAVMLLNPDRSGLRNRKSVEKLRQLYLQCLYVYLQKHHPDMYEELFSRILDVLPLSAAVNESHARKMNDIKSRKTVGSDTQAGGQFTFPDLHNDVFQ